MKIAMSSVPRVIIKPRRAQPFFSRHPWVFAGAIQRIQTEDGVTANPGDEVSVHSAKGEFIGRGLLNHNSNIRVRMYSWVDEPLDDVFWTHQLGEAIRLRERLFQGSPTDAYRLIFSEADGLSGLTVDRYGDWLLVQFTSLAMYQRRDVVIDFLKERVQPKGIWMRTDRGVLEAEGLELEDGLVCGEPPARPLFIQQNELQFGVDVNQGQKTGFYLDQRGNREAVASYVNGGRVLDCFCYTGGFGIAAAKFGGSKDVVGLDSSESALEIAAANAELNGVAQFCRFEKADVKVHLTKLKEAREQYDLIVLDPPKLARSRGGLTRATKAYFRMNESAVNLLPPGGILATASCSGLVSPDHFEQMLGSVARETGRPIRILESRSQPSDHPVSANCPESRYLKLLICEVG
jgi:23S rRNA (cytosine1962-C5)-methyltransferase